MSEWTAGQTSINIRGASTRRPGPRLQEPGAGADQRPSRRHRQRLQALAGRRRAHRDRARPLVGGLRQPEHGRRDQHHPQDRPHRARHAGRGQRRLVVAVPGQGAERRHRPASSTGMSASKAGSRGDYDRSGNVTEQNTHWTRYGGTGAFGVQIDEDQRVDLTVRSDGIYDAGFRGSASNVFAFDNRFNQSVDVAYTGKTPDGRGSLFFQGYYVQDVDDLNNRRSRSARSMPSARAPMSIATGASSISSARASSRATSPGRPTSCCSGIDWERSTVRSDRYRLTNCGRQPALAAGQQPDRKRLRVLCRGCAALLGRPDHGARRRAPDLRQHGDRLRRRTRRPCCPSSNNYQATTYSVGATLRGHRLAQPARRRLERLPRADRRPSSAPTSR